MAEVPLADDGRRVAGLLQGLRQRALLQRQAVLRPRPDHADLQPVPHRIAARHQGGPRRGADRLHVELLEPRARRRELVEVRRLDLLAAVEADVGIAQVVGQDEDDVRFALLRTGRIEKGRCDEQGQDEAAHHHGPPAGTLRLHGFLLAASDPQGMILLPRRVASAV